MFAWACRRSGDDTGLQDRALADPARPVQHREPGGEHVRRDDLGLPPASEEEECIELGVLERRETLVRAEQTIP